MFTYYTVHGLILHFRYPDILNMQLGLLYQDDLMSLVMPTIRQKLRDVAEGSLPHAENVLGFLVLRLSSMLAFSIAEEPVELPEAPCEPPREAENAAQTGQGENATSAAHLPRTYHTPTAIVPRTYRRRHNRP